MCGIFGYVGGRKALEVALKGLKKLEYRGYDSAGLAAIHKGELLIWKEVGKITEVEKLLPKNADFSCAIAHTRWATHGIPSRANAHPHFDEKKTVAVVHNGIIENYALLRSQMRATFVSQTDTEVIPYLIAKSYDGDFLDACVKTFQALEGSFALAIIHKEHPNQMVAAAKESPLVVGFSQNENELFVASDPQALADTQAELFFLQNGEIAFLQKGKKPQFYDAKGHLILKKPYVQKILGEKTDKGQFEHHMLKEIFEQKIRINDVLKGRVDTQECTAYFEELKGIDFANFKRIILVACGTSWHAAYYGAYLLEEYAGVAARAEIASEFRYRHPVVDEQTLLIVMSQSGETADTIACLRDAKKKGAFVLAVCNVAHSTIDREADRTLLMRAGPEVAVASTKTFTCQLMIMALFSLFLSRQRGKSKKDGRQFLEGIYEVPFAIASVLSESEAIKNLAAKYAHFNDFFFLARDFCYPIALEAALKMREIAYVDATGTPAGEMKHGPIAFLNERVPVIFLCADDLLFSKILSNLMECKARRAPIIAFAWKEFEGDLKNESDDLLFIPRTKRFFSCFPLAIYVQLFAYYIATERKTDVDQPRNLAKSVTVE